MSNCNIYNKLNKKFEKISLINIDDYEEAIEAACQDIIDQDYEENLIQSENIFEEDLDYENLEDYDEEQENWLDYEVEEISFEEDYLESLNENCPELTRSY